MSSGGGFFGLFNYSKPGKGVRKDEPERSRFVQFFVLVKRKFWKLIQLNLLYILFCIPIVTIGPATAAMTYVLRLYANEQPVFMFSDFWDNFKANFKQSFAHSVLVAVATVILFIAIRFYSLNAPQHKWMYIFLGLSVMVAFIAILANFYVSLMIVTLELKFRHILKNAFLLAILCIKTNLITFFFVFLCWFLMIGFFPITILVILLLGFSFTNFIIVYNSYPGIEKYAIQPFLEKQEEELEALGVEVDEDEVESIFTDELEVQDEEEKEKQKKEDKKQAASDKVADDFLGL